MKRSTYSNVAEMKVRFGKLELHFLRTMAAQHGVALSEMVRRFVGETLTKYREAGWYQPEPEQETASPENALSIRVGKEMDGSLWYEYPNTFSPGLSQAVVSILNRHASELKGLVSPPVNEPATHAGGESGEATNP